ncbi:HutD/Ves family protein [Arthrobacter sp. C152]
MMRLIRFELLTPQLWRNGGGVTREVARFPTAPMATAAGAAGDDWDWRVSIADVAKEGDFSLFPGMERVLTVIGGNHMTLTGDGWEQKLEKYRPFQFSGDTHVHGTLPAGGIRDLNVITRKKSFTGRTTIMELEQNCSYPISEGQLGILLQGRAAVSDGAQVVFLSRYDSVVGSDTQAPRITGSGILAVVSIAAVA